MYSLPWFFSQIYWLSWTRLLNKYPTLVSPSLQMRSGIESQEEKEDDSVGARDMVRAREMSSLES